MKLAFVGKKDLPGVEADAAFAKEHGFAGLEYDYWATFDRLERETVVRPREIQDRHGISTAAFGLWGWNHLAADPEERARSHEMLVRAIQYAEILGAGLLITGGGQLPDASVEENAAEFVRVFPPFLERAAEAGLTVAFYPVHSASFFVNMEAYS